MLEGAIEGILFLVGSDGISLEKLSSILDISKEEVIKLIDNLILKYKSDNSGISIEILGNLYKLVTKIEYKEYFERLVEIEKKEALSQQSLETLAVVAYNEPVTRSFVDNIRGVDSSYLMRKLLLKNMIIELGRSELPGRPILYGIAPNFLDYLGLASKDDLPKIEIEEVEDEELNLYESKYNEK